MPRVLLLQHRGGAAREVVLNASGCRFPGGLHAGNHTAGLLAHWDWPHHSGAHRLNLPSEHAVDVTSRLSGRHCGRASTVAAPPGLVEAVSALSPAKMGSGPAKKWGGQLEPY